MSQLPNSGREREIFVRALREYSDRCEAPELTPSCPFYQADPQGPWCLEECMDLLAEHPPESRGGIPLGASLLAHPRRRRARSVLAGRAKPFDAAEIYIEDESR